MSSLLHRPRPRRVFSWRYGGAVLTFVGIFAAAACASSGGSAGSASASTRAPRTNPNVITSAEIEARHAVTAMELVLTLRPTWEHVGVYVNNRLFGNFERLGEIPADSVKEIRMLSLDEAMVQLGINNQKSILVTKK